MNVLAHLPLPQPQSTLIFILLGGALAQLLSAWLRLPSILFLLFLGFALGPEGAGWVQPALLEPFRPAAIQLLVAIIMFEGSLSLRLREVREHGGMVRDLLTLGLGLTFLGAFASCRWIMGTGFREALVFASLMVVTGPTVILPLLKRLGAQDRVQSILKWEGILIDPLGGILTVLCLDLALSPDLHPVPLALGFAVRIGLGIALGLAAGYVAGWLFRWRFLLGHGIGELGGMLGLALALAVYGGSETLLPESGLIAVTAFGLRLGHTKFPFKHEIVTFKEQVTTVAISTAFVWLASSIRVSDLSGVLPLGAWVVAVLLFVVRPIAVWASDGRGEVSAREKGFLSLIAPRGIVAASFAFFAADRLNEAGGSGGQILVPLTFLVIIASVLWAGLLGGPLAALFGVKKPRPRGLLLVGANAFGRWLAHRLEGRLPEIRLVDPREEFCRTAESEGLLAHLGNPTDQEFLKGLDLRGVGKALAATASRDSNILSCQIAGRFLGPDHVFRLDAREPGRREREAGSETWGTPLTDLPFTAAELVSLAEEGRIVGEWRRQESWWFRVPSDPPRSGPWILLAVHRGRVLFPGEARFPRGAEILQVRVMNPHPSVGD